MTTRQILDLHRTELEAILREYLEKINGVTTDEELLAIRRHENLVLLDKLTDQKRVMQIMAGETPEPVTHHAQGVLVGIFGDGRTETA